MKITIDIATDNAAFEDRDAEIARIVTDIARRFDADGPHSFPLRDYNGNKVGVVTVDDSGA